jgi:hypothetical protein
MGKFSNSFMQPKKFSNPNNTKIFNPYSTELANVQVIPIWETLGITEQEYIARQNAHIYDATSIETAILNKIENNIDPFINDNIISMIEHEDVDTINTLIASQTVTNNVTGKTVGNIVEEIKNAIYNATINDASTIETAILNSVDPTTDNNIISMVAYEDVDTINTLIGSQTIKNATTGLKVGDIVQQIETFIHSKNL